MRKKYLNNLLLLILLVVDFSIVFILLHDFIYNYKNLDKIIMSDIPCFNKLKYGDRVPKFKSFHDNILRRDINGYITIFLFFVPDRAIHRIRLLGVDNFIEKYKDEVLLIAISQGDIEWLFDLGFVLKNGSIIKDYDMSLWELFGVDPRCGGTIVVDRSGKVIFSDVGLTSVNILKEIVLRTMKVDKNG